MDLEDVDSTDFSVKAAYNILMGEESVVVKEPFAKLWTLKTLPSTQFMALRVLCNVIATKDNLLRRGISLVCVRYPLCGVEEESDIYFLNVGSLGEFRDCVSSG